MISYMKTEFGNAVDRAVKYESKKGKNSTWYLDQKIISILIFGWIKQHGPDRIRLLKRDIAKDRSALNDNVLSCECKFVILE